MRAIIYTRYGPPEVVRLADVQKPEPKDNELLVRVQATTVNRTDCGFRSAEYVITRFFSGLFKPKNKTLGNEFAGEIERTGSQVTAFKVGDQVFGYNDITFGAHAEYLVIPEHESVALMPRNVTYEVAAAITEGAHYALCGLRAAKIKPGHKILINGATGAIGSAAVQLAKHFGAHVTAVTDTSHVELVRSLHADEVIDYLKEDFTARQTVFDIVFDAVGKSSFGKCKPLLTKRGVYMSTELGKRSENIFLALITPLLGGRKVLFPIPSINKQDVNFLRALVEKNTFRPLIDRSYALEDIIDAYRYVESGQKTGNVIITLN